MLGVVLLSALATLAVADMHIAKRDNTSNAYAPKVAACPAGISIRTGVSTRELSPRYADALTPSQATLDASEAAYIQAKSVASVPVWTEYLNMIGLEDFNVSSFVPSAETAVGGSTLPMVAFAASGGGVRAMLVGGGML